MAEERSISCFFCNAIILQKKGNLSKFGIKSETSKLNK